MKKIDKKNIEDIFALSPMQEGMLFHYLKDNESDYYFVQLCLTITGEIDLNCFQQAWDFVVETNEMLRTVFRWERVKNPVQMVLKEHRLKPKYYDFSKKRIGETHELREDIKTEDRKETFDLRHVPFRVTLCKIDERFYEMVVSNHHILYDGWSSGIILKEFFEAYSQLFLKNTLIPPVKNKFKEFVKWIQNKYLQEEEKYWKEYLKGFDSETDISLKRKTGEEISETGSYLFPFFSGKKDILENFVRAHKITLASLLYGAWGILLQKINDSEDVMFGTTVSGRSANVKGIENVVGLFINTIPLRVQTHGDSDADADDDEKIVDLVYRINDILRVREKYESTSLVKIKEWIGVTNEALFDSIVVVENYPLYVDLDTLLGKKNGGLSIDSYSMFEMTHYDLAVGISIFSDIEVRFVYNKERFNEQAITTLRSGFTSIIKDIINNPGKEISWVEIISGEEKRRILFDFNDTQSDYPAEKTILTLFETQVERNVNKIAVLYEDEQLSYHELNIRASQLGRLLRKKGVTADTIVGLVVERSIEIMVGIFGILKAGGAYLPIDPDYPEERIRYMLADSAVDVLVTTRNLFKEGEKKEIIYLEDYKEKEGIHHSSFITHHSDNLAYIIYTSGSTGNPKGVMIEHSQLVNFIYHMYNEYNRDFDFHDRCLSLTNITFDVCVCELFLPIAFGSCIVILSEKKKSNVNDLAETILDKGITFAYIPPGLLRELNIELKTHASKLRLNKMLVGVEPIRDDVLEDYLALNKTMLILNGYGPTETTICSTTYPYRSHKPGGKIVPIGLPLSNTTIFILDRKGCLVPIGVPGEICISGDGKGRGYLNNPDLTAGKFVENPFEPGERMYRTGDRGKWLPDGYIQFLGRMDNQVKIRGYRIELGEIENQLLRYKGIKKTVVMAREDEKGDKYLCAYVVPGSLAQQAADSPDSIDAIPSTRSISLNVSELRDYVSNRLPHYMIPAYFMQIEEIPLTPNGKIDRSALPSPEINAEKEYAAPRNEIEEQLVALWSEVLEKKKEKIGIDANFFDRGGHSLKATILLNRIHKALHVRIPLTEMFKTPTIRGLSGYIKQVAKDQYAAVEPAAPAEYYPLSSSQKRNYILWQMEKKNMNYNMSEAIILEGRLDINRFETTFLKLIRRHESFRTSFEIIDGEPVQKIHDEVAFRIEYQDIPGNQVEVEGEEGNPHSPHHLIKNFIRPFDLSIPPILRVGLLKLEEQEHLLILDMHHIIADGTSVGIFIRDFMALYSGKMLPPLRIQPKDFAQWQNKRKPNESLKQQEAYWLKEFAGEPPLLNMPIDFKRPSRQSFEGRILPFEISREAAAALKERVKEEEVTLFMLLLAVINVWLWKLSGSETIVVGSPIANRRHADLDGVIGQFVNTLALKNRPRGEKTFTDFLKEVAQKTLDAYENQEYPFEDLVEKVVDRRDPGRQPIFDVMFALHNMEIFDITIPGLTLTIFGYDPDVAQFDLYLVAYEREDRLAFKVGYCTRLFKQETIESFIHYFQEIIDTVTDNKDIQLKAINISHQLLEPDASILREADGDFEF